MNSITTIARSTLLPSELRVESWTLSVGRSHLCILLLLLLSLCPASHLQAQVDDHNPVGAMGTFEGVITTGCAYNVLNHGTTRPIDDIVVPGSIGKYPLKMTRYYVSRDFANGSSGPTRLGCEWRHEYSWSQELSTGKVEYANGNVWDNHCFDPVGVSDWWDTNAGGFRLADGGIVKFDSLGRESQIIDPYGQTTTITYASDSTWMKVTEHGGRYLYFTYTPGVNGLPSLMLTEVDAYDGRGNRTDWVVYNYTAIQPSGNNTTGNPMNCLTRVDYSDGQHAYYTYEDDNVPNDPTHGSTPFWPLVKTCNDVRYHGPMRRIAYDYQGGGPHGAITAERYSNQDGVEGVPVSSISGSLPAPRTSLTVDFPVDFTETRGDNNYRTFHYTALKITRASDDNTCPTQINMGPPSQFLLNYTDFQQHTTYLGYDQNTWYLTSVQDANNHTTYYDRGPDPPHGGIGQITKITHPDSTYIQYGYESDPHYLHSITNERLKQTTYTRDPNTHLITRIDYPSDAVTQPSYEEFTYDNNNNNFGQVLTHHLKNGDYQHFQYDSRGLLTAKTNPTTISDWQTAINQAPKTTYTYYTTGDNIGWIDRVKTMTLPQNVSGLSASETYEYDLSSNNTSRGLVTKIQHADGKYQSFFYDAYGNKQWEENELGKHTSYIYDDYKRVTSVTDPMIHTTSYDYSPTQGGTQWQLHTTNSPWFVTSPAQIVTHNVYDENWRKTSVTAAYNTLNLTTAFVYDNVGNLTQVTDPRLKVTRHGYDNRNRKVSTTEAYGTSLQATTVWHYDGASNIFQTDRPDQKSETMGHDALNRRIWHSEPRDVPGASPTPTPIALTTHIYYNPSGTINYVVDERGKVTSFQYNPSDEKTTMSYTGPSPAPFQSWVWDDAHNLASRTTVNGNAHPTSNEVQRFSYDCRNRKIQMTWDNTLEWAQFSYDYASRLTEAKNGTGTVGQNVISDVTRQYDDANHLTLDRQNVTGLGINSVNYPAYDADGRLTQMNITGASYNYIYGYDGAGRLTTITPFGRSVQFQYAYDASSNETDRYAYLPNNVTIHQVYGRDSLDRMSSRLVKNGINGTTTFSTEAYTYDHMNRIYEVNRGGAADDFNYYWDGELQWATYGGGPHTPFQEGQDPDLDTTDNVDVNAGYQPPNTQEPEATPPPDDYSDPKVGGLIPSDLPGVRSLGYYFDKAGNRQEVTDTLNPTINYVINNINQYTSVSRGVISNGAEHEVSSFQGLYDNHPVSYTYINDEHLKTVGDAVDGTYNLSYDALGRCVKRDLNGTITYYIYDGDKPILEHDGNISIVGSNVYGKGIDEILMRTEQGGANNGQPMYYAQDHEGSVTHLINGCTTTSCGTGNVLEKYAYDAFGVPTFMDGNSNNRNPNATAYNNRFLFTGREYAATYRGTYVSTFSFYEYRARAYNPTLGRFMSEDPKGFDAGDYNLFRYCHNDPVDLTDPMGLAADDYRLTWAKTGSEDMYNKAMAAAQWAGSDLRGSAGAIAIGGAGYQAWLAKGGLSMGLETQKQAQGGIQYRYTRYEGPEGHRTDYNDGGADFRWQLNEYYPESKTTKPIKEYGWGNKEVEIKHTGNIGTVVPSKTVIPLSSKGVMSDHVAPIALDPGGRVHGTATFREEVYERVGNVWALRPGMTTQITHTYDRNATGAWRVDSDISTP
jgi:RHS repeat-associated protein